MNKDTLYAQPHDNISGFQFNDEVADVFSDMIQRSVPGYATILHMIGQLSERYAQENTTIYDLGCSLGGATLAMRRRVKAPNTRIYGVDNSEAMLHRCQQMVDADNSQVPVELIHSDLQTLTFRPASVMVMNFVLQFIPIHDRLALLKRIADSLVENGIFILSEKICFDDAKHNQLMIELHHNFKRSNGYSDLEVAQKRNALEDVLIPESMQEHRDRLLSAGFKRVECWFQCFNFMSLVASK